MAKKIIIVKMATKANSDFGCKGYELIRNINSKYKKLRAFFFL